MTLCIAWKDEEGVHFASDSRLTVAKYSFADVGVKVMAIPFRILDPVDANNEDERTVSAAGELGMCFAGSAVNSLVIKESLTEVLKNLQHVPGYSDTSLKGVATFAFSAYKLISQRICETALGPKGRADLLLGGLCPVERSIRVFRFSTDAQNQYSCSEVLTSTGYELLGSGAPAARAELPQTPTALDYLNVLRSVIADSAVESVGGNIQYGCFTRGAFRVYGIYDFGPPIRYWRCGLDLNGPEFMENESGLVPGVPFIDPEATLGV